MNIRSFQSSLAKATAQLPAVDDSRRHSERLHALDALRGIAMLLGVGLHASVAYMPHRMPNLLWPVHDRAASPLFDWLFWWIHGFRLPLFFLLAGFFSMLVYDKCGPWAYLAHRSKRLLLPLLAATVTLLPLIFAVWCYGWLITGQCTWEEVRRVKFSPAIQPNLYGPAHLWFLEYLFFICVLFCGVRGLCSLMDWSAGDWCRRLLASAWRPLVLAGPAALLLWLDSRVLTDFRNSFLPEPLRLVYYGWFFIAGAALWPLRHQLETLVSHSTLFLLLTVPIMIATGMLLPRYLSAQLGGVGMLALALSSALLAGLSVFGYLGLFLRLFRRERAVLRYMADASYWIYLSHFPLVGLLQILLAPVSAPAAIKFVLVLAPALAVGLATFHWLVRFTLLGTFLNGSRSKVPIRLPPARSAAA